MKQFNIPVKYQAYLKITITIFSGICSNLKLNIAVMFFMFFLSSAMPQSLEVTKTYDRLSGQPGYENTLRWAVQLANDPNFNYDTIKFNISTVSLPCIVDLIYGDLNLNHSVYIDGNSQPIGNYNGIEPRIEIKCGFVDSTADCFKINYSGVEIKNLTINGFHNGIVINEYRQIKICNNVIINSHSAGIYADRCCSSLFQDNYIGTTRSLKPNCGNGEGIRVNAPTQGFSSYNVFYQNTIIGNSRVGIFLYDNSSGYINRNQMTKNRIYNHLFKAIRLDNANYNYPAPEIIGINGTVIQGTSYSQGDSIEIFGSTGEQNANKYLGTTITNSDNTWIFTIPSNENWPFITSTATTFDSIQANTSELSAAFPYNSVSFTTLESHYCETSSPVVLTGNPAGGSFYGPGIQGNMFYPSLVDPDEPTEVTITYRYYFSDTLYHESSQTTTIYPSEFYFTYLNPSCSPGADGRLTLNVKEGSGSYRFNWSTNNGTIPPGQQNSESIFPIPIGDYYVDFSDTGYGCPIQYLNFTLTNPKVSVKVENLIVCKDTTIDVQATAFRNVNPPNAQPPYTYKYSWFKITQDSTILIFEGLDDETSSLELPIGKYRLIVTDQIYYCSGSIDFNVTTSSPKVTVGSIKNVNCYGYSDGMAVANIAGGIPPFVYNWYKTGSSGDDLIYTGSAFIKNLSAGTYYVVIINENGNGCMMKSNNFTIAEPGELRILDPIKVDACTAIINIEGGTPEYRFSIYKDVLNSNNIHLWKIIHDSSTMDNKIVIEDLGVGYYRVTVDDINECGPVEAIFQVGEIGLTKKYELCFRFRGELEPPVVVDPPAPTPVDSYVKNITKSISSKSINCIDQANAEMAKVFINTCGDPASIHDELIIAYTQNPYHYTLYYYDRAGNLVRTVPPKGVDSEVESRSGLPDHHMVTEYDYNNINQVIRQKTPDGNESKFLYDAVGRLRFSQNAKQAAVSNALVFSYSKYDELSRIIEVGECRLPSGTTWSMLNPSNQTFPVDNNSTVDNTQQIWTIYNRPATVTYYGKEQRFLDNRISYTMTSDGVVTYYSYDPHGNVEWLIQDLPGFRKSHIGYEYDLISNKVNKVKYNEGNPEDRLFHKYSYDEDNRLVTVETSRDGYLWETDGVYTYYPHGPLQSLEIGKDKLQKIDYSYTINGWLKGINYPSLVGQSSGGWPADVFGTSLQYYSKDPLDPNDHGDYVTSQSSYNFEQDHAYNTTSRLYNGNIVAWTSKFDISSLPLNAQQNFKYGNNNTGNLYKYDKLNRLKESNFVVNDGTTWIPNPTNGYKCTFQYDPNGNIINLTRNIATENTQNEMDDLQYIYKDQYSNRLDTVQDALTGTTGTVDGQFDDITGIHSYTYDQIGNLISDLDGSLTGISSIEWNAYGKISKVQHVANSPLPNLEFKYDAAGNRVIKKRTYSNPSNIITDYYVRDAQGNIMTIYSNTFDPGASAKEFIVEEQPIYGSNRLGVISTGESFVVHDIANIDAITMTGPMKRTLGLKSYELTDHLGNVRAVTKDYLSYDLKSQVKSLVDYYAFGMKLNERIFNLEVYRYGYGRNEWMNETSGTANTVDLGDRWLDVRIGRTFKMDKLTIKFPSETPYIYGGNNPIYFIDAQGKYKYPAEKVAEYQKKYPMLTKYLESQVKKDVLSNSKILQAYADVTLGNLSIAKVEEMVTWGSGPEIIFEQNPGFPQKAYGYYDRWFERIELSESIAEQLETLLESDASEDEKMDAFLPWFKTLLHEGAHYGNYDKDLIRINKGSEVGDEFENKVWGKEGVYNVDEDDMYNQEISRRVINDQKQAGNDGTLPTLPAEKSEKE